MQSTLLTDDAQEFLVFTSVQGSQSTGSGAPTQKMDWRLSEAKLEGPQQFRPIGYERAAEVEKMRMGEDLGKDAPYNNLYAEHWAKRRYNTKIEKYPWNVSESKSVFYADKLNVFIVQWQEDGVYRFRWFKAQYGRLRAKRSAERFRQKLETLGRVDGLRSERYLRMKFLEKKKQREITARRYALITSGVMA